MADRVETVVDILDEEVKKTAEIKKLYGKDTAGAAAMLARYKIDWDKRINIVELRQAAERREAMNAKAAANLEGKRLGLAKRKKAVQRRPREHKKIAISQE